MRLLVIVHPGPDQAFQCQVHPDLVESSPRRRGRAFRDRFGIDLERRPFVSNI